VAPHTAKIHTPITLGISMPTTVVRIPYNPSAVVNGVGRNQRPAGWDNAGIQKLNDVPLIYFR
jgi:hypothetical protein